MKKSLRGIKFDDGKAPISLISSTMLFKLANVLKFGAAKYQKENWRKGFKWSRCMDAAMRHILAYNNGEIKDPESKESHLAHAIANLMFLLEFEEHKTGENDLWRGYKK